MINTHCSFDSFFLPLLKTSLTELATLDCVTCGGVCVLPVDRQVFAGNTRLKRKIHMTVGKKTGLGSDRLQILLRTEGHYTNKPFCPNLRRRKKERGVGWFAD